MFRSSMLVLPIFNSLFKLFKSKKDAFSVAESLRLLDLGGCKFSFQGEALVTATHTAGHNTCPFSTYRFQHLQFDSSQVLFLI